MAILVTVNAKGWGRLTGENTKASFLIFGEDEDPSSLGRFLVNTATHRFNLSKTF